jgi:c-di-GMP-related signal transduction protein
MNTLLERVPVDSETKAALLGQTGGLGALYQLMLAQESGEWAKASALTKDLGLSDDSVGNAWWRAMIWAQEVAGNG